MERRGTMRMCEDNGIRTESRKDEIVKQAKELLVAIQKAKRT